MYAISGMRGGGGGGDGDGGELRSQRRRFCQNTRKFGLRGQCAHFN